MGTHYIGSSELRDSYPICIGTCTNEQIREAEEIQIEITYIDLYEIEFFDLINNVDNNDQIDIEIIEDFVIFA